MPKVTAKSIITDMIIRDNLDEWDMESIQKRTNIQLPRNAITNPADDMPMERTRSASCPK
jgi:hypothetical protein